jgi:hypothetical protein
MLAQVLAHTAIVDHFRGDAVSCMQHAQRTIEVSEARGIPLRLAEGNILLAWARCELGEGAAIIGHIERAVEAWNRGLPQFLIAPVHQRNQAEPDRIRNPDDG